MLLRIFKRITKKYYIKFTFVSNFRCCILIKTKC